MRAYRGDCVSKKVQFHIVKLVLEGRHMVPSSSHITPSLEMQVTSRKLVDLLEVTSCVTRCSIMHPMHDLLLSEPAATFSFGPPDPLASSTFSAPRAPHPPLICFTTR
ncbi:hypothetical protein KC19_4G137600 [Ceratodon purpureus]|uniref:Uncharacterized protein n=1 Tax=Ceratodon purpureus TaxID=3225 RepID=A0A8T0I8M9_CERPU|nr:hypothetical protein KC19_4G137600 [Ceratodon purpureus]